MTDAFLSAYLHRPELRPVDDSCAAEIALHGDLLRAPRLAVDAGRIAAITDADARSNYEVVLGFRDRLVEAESVEACYLTLVRSPSAAVPPLFIDQLTHVIARNMLDGCDDALRLRAAELLFRSQRVSVQDGAIMVADEETVRRHAEGGGFGDLGRLLAEAETPTRGVDLDVLGPDNEAAYWQRSDRHDMVLDLRFGGPGLNALCAVLGSWIAHFFAAEIAIEPVGMIRDERWVWHVGLDAESSAILNDLYDGNEVGEDRIARLLSLFRLTFRDPALMRPDIAGRPVYLGMAMDKDNLLRLKPQNLLVNLPLAEPV